MVAVSASPKVQALIDAKDLELGEELGEGEFGSVLKGKWKNHDGKLLDVSRVLCSVENFSVLQYCELIYFKL